MFDAINLGEKIIKENKINDKFCITFIKEDNEIIEVIESNSVNIMCSLNKC